MDNWAKTVAKKAMECKSLKWLPQPTQGWHKQKYITESSDSGVLAAFRLGNAELGNRYPRNKYLVKKTCPVCRRHENNELNLVFQCSSVSKKRKELGITQFYNSFKVQGMSDDMIFRIYLGEQMINGYQVDAHTLRNRGKCLGILKKTWLSKWPKNGI